MARRNRFKKTIFDNGLTVITEAHPEFKSLSVGAWVKVGTRHEQAREAGMSHFLEHMLFKGTNSRSALDIAKEIDQVGGDFNAFTGREFTAFHLLLLSRDTSLAVDILIDILLNSQFDAMELERERKVILQEIAMIEESPEELVHDLFFERIYGRHGLGRPILGTPASIKRTDRLGLLRFFRRNYRPDQIIIAAAGDLSHDSFVRKLRSLCRGNWPGRGRKGHERVFEAAPLSLKMDEWWVSRATEQVHLVWGVEAPRYSAKDRFAVVLLNTFLGGGMSSSLFQEIREKHALAYTVYSSLSPFCDSGVFTVYAATSEKKLGLCIRLIEECTSRLRKTLLSSDELELVKENVKGNVLLSADSVESRMFSLAKNEIFFNQHFSIDDVCRMIDDVQPEDIRRLARKIFRPNRRSLLALGPGRRKKIVL